MLESDLGREGLVHLDEADVGERQARALERRRDGERGPHQELAARDPPPRRPRSLMKASGSIPSRARPRSSDIRSTAAAPSVSGEELPAVTVP